MFKWYFRKIKELAGSIGIKEKGSADGKIEKHTISSDLEKNIKEINDTFSKAEDVVLRQFTIPLDKPIRAFMVYIDGLSEKSTIYNNLLGALMDISYNNCAINIKGNVISVIRDTLISIAEVKNKNDYNEIIEKILEGDIALFLEGSYDALIISAREWESRPVSEPETETVVRGPREGFTETIRTNTTLIRRRIKTSRLKFEPMKIGAITKTAVDICYIDGIVNDRIVQEVRERLFRIKVDSILESGNIEELIEDSPYSLFPTINYTERPDKVAAGLLEGQVAILVDTTPFVLLLPVTFPQFFQASEDYYNRYPWGVFIRLLRLVTVNIALLLPSLYVAIVTYHHEMLPTPLLMSIASGREGVPFPAFVEALLMEFTFEILREGGVRLPRPIGQAVSIVGALVIGEAAVSAGLVSPPMVIVVSLTAVASFTLPSSNGAIPLRLLRFPIMVMAGSLGLFGVMVALMFIIIHLVSLRSFGVPYMSPLAPVNIGDLKDTLIRVPWWAMYTRPSLIGQKKPIRQENDQKPQVPDENQKTMEGGNNDRER